MELFIIHNTYNDHAKAQRANISEVCTKLSAERSRFLLTKLVVIADLII